MEDPLCRISDPKALAGAMAPVIKMNEESHLLIRIVVHYMLVGNNCRANIIANSEIEVEASPTAAIICFEADGVKQ